MLIDHVRARRRLTWAMTGFTGYLALAALAVTSGVAPVRAAALDRTVCDLLRSEHQSLMVTGVKTDMARGASAAKDQLDAARIERIARFLKLEEDLRFRCAALRPKKDVESEADDAGTAAAAAPSAPPTKPAKPTAAAKPASTAATAPQTASKPPPAKRPKAIPPPAPAPAAPVQTPEPSDKDD